MIFGAHVSTAGGLENAPERAQNIGADAIQIFGSAPQSFRYSEPKTLQIELFKKRSKDANIHPVFFHGVYLINLASEKTQLVSLAIDSLVAYQKLASDISALGTIFHLGSHKGRGLKEVLKQVVDACLEILEKSPREVFLIFENAAATGGKIGGSFSEIGEIIKAIGSPQIKVCMDTCHAFTSGYAIHEKEGLDSTLSEFDKEIGLERLVAIHANDSKAPLLSGVDRHENIGEGYIGKAGFEVIVNHPKLHNLPFIIEVPGFDQKGPDRKNLEILRSLVKR